MYAQSLSPAPDGTNPGLVLLIRLRWLALLGQIALFAFSSLQLHILLPWGVLIPCMAMTALTNAAASFFKSKNIRQQRVLCSALLLLDTVTLTTMLYWTGGAHNPFATFYLLHIAIATLLLPFAMGWAMVLLCSVCYSLLFTSEHMLHTASAYEFCGSYDFHLQGMLLSMILVGMGIVYFAGQLKAALARKEAQLQEAQRNAVRNERFAALATLAAGVAHELATPLGTIAIVSEDMQEQAGNSCRSVSCQKDAALIRSEVQRCRNIIEKLREQTTDGNGDTLQTLQPEAISQSLQSYLKPEYWQRLRVDNHCQPQTALRVPQTALLQSLAVLVKNGCQSDQTGNAVRLIIAEQAGSVHFTVEDKGCGMDAATLARAGEPFFTTKEPDSGMGLGLFLVRMFAERINGTLTIDSSPHAGTRATLILTTHENAAD